MGDIVKVKVEPCEVTWGRAQVQTVTCVADTSSSLNSTFFHLYSALDETHYYVWIDVGSAGVNPSVSGATGVEVDIAEDATAAQVATAVASAINALAPFGATADGAVVTVTNADLGYATPASNGSASPVFTYAVTTVGAKLAGFTDGDVELSVDEQMVDVTAHQTGTNVLSRIRTGLVIEDVTIAFKETSVAQMRDYITQMGASMTPSGGTEAFGIGTSKQFTQVLDQAEKLVMHPVVLAAGTLTRDWAFWKAYPKLDSVSHSAENPMMVNVSFQVYPDYTKDARVRYCVFGNHTQDFDA